MPHNPHYDFNDDILPLGASYCAPRRNAPGKTRGLRQDTAHDDQLDRTHQTVKDLTAAGFTNAQAEAPTSALRQVQQIDLSDLATKGDTADIRREMATKIDLEQVRREMAEIKSELIKWVVGIGFAPVATLLAVLKLFAAGHP